MERGWVELILAPTPPRPTLTSTPSPNILPPLLIPPLAPTLAPALALALVLLLSLLLSSPPAVLFAHNQTGTACNNSGHNPLSRPSFSFAKPLSSCEPWLSEGGVIKGVACNVRAKVNQWFKALRTYVCSLQRSSWE